MPNVRISDLPDAITPLDTTTTFFEVQAVEGGVDVSRRVRGDMITFTVFPPPTVEGSIVRGNTTTMNYEETVFVIVSDGTANDVTLDGDSNAGSSPLNLILNAPTGQDNSIRWEENSALTYRQFYDSTAAEFKFRSATGVPVRFEEGNGTVVMAQFDPVTGQQTLWAGTSGSDVPVMRTVLPASGGLEVDNQVTGAGFERVLTTSDIGAGLPTGSQFDTVFIQTAPDTYASSSQLQVTGDGASFGGLTVGISGISVRGRFAGTAGSGGTNQTLIQGFDDDADVGLYLLGMNTTGVSIDGDSYYAQNFRDSGHFEIFVRDSGSTDRKAFGADPDVETGLWHPPTGVQVTRTVTPASGGLEVDNQSTGAGFERVLTTSDATGGGVTVEDEGVPLATVADTLNFVGAGVTATGAGTTKTITVADIINGVTGNRLARWDGSQWAESTNISQLTFGIRIDGNTATSDIIIEQRGSTGTLFTEMRNNQFGNFVIFTNRLGRGVTLTGRNAGDTANNIGFDFDPDGDASMHHIGVEVARTLTAASGGFEVNNLSTGAGFERVLTTSDLGGGGAQISGTPANNQVGVWVNATDIEGASDLTWDGSDLVAGGDLIDLNNSGAATLASLQTRNSAGGVRLDAIATTGNSRIVQTNSAGTLENIWIQMTRNGGVSLRHNDDSVLETRAGDGIEILGDGTDCIIELSTDASVQLGFIRSFVAANDSLEIRNTNGGDIDLFHANNSVARTLVAGSGGFEVNNTLTGAGFERVLTTSDTAPTETGVTSGPGTYYRTVDLSRTNNTVANDSELTTGNTLEGTSYYKVEVFVHFECASATPDLRVGLNGTTGATVAVQWWSNDEHTTAFGENVLGDAGESTFGQTATFELDGTNDRMVRISAYVFWTSGGANSRSISVSWAQNTTNATAVIIKRGSWMTIERIAAV